MLSRRAWFWYFLAAIFSYLLWFNLAYPQLAFIDLSVNRKTALKIAQTYLQKERGVAISPYRSATVFIASNSTDVYLQKALGFNEELNFFKKYDFELFFWKIRFFQELQKEEYGVVLSASTGEVTDCVHVIEANAARPDEGKARAQEYAVKFLQKNFAYDLTRDYLSHSDSSNKHDQRIDYAFFWERKDVFIPWTQDKSQGGAKLLTAALISGKEVLSFYKYKLLIPDQFNRDLEKKRAVGNNFSILLRIVFLGLLVITVFFVATRRNNLVMHRIKKFAAGITTTIFVLTLLAYFNHFQHIIYSYPTTISFVSYLWQNLSNFLLDAFVASLGILLPCLAGETLQAEVFPDKKEGRFLHYLNSTFLSRYVSRLIVLGYLIAMILLGVQSAAFAFGQKYLGVWIEHTWLASLSGNMFPLLAAFTIGFSASVNEEIFFRIFGISLGKKFLKNTFLAVLLSSLIWGFGHSSYPVYPMWFRGLEVTVLGLILSFIYLRYGIIPVLVAHYLFDVFWYSAAYLLGKTTPCFFYSTVAVLLLPLFWAMIAYLANRPTQERPLRWHLNKHQIYNLEILKKFISSLNIHWQNNPKPVKEKIISHGWDPAVVDTAFEDLKKNPHDTIPEK